MSKAFITGISGQDGSHLAEQLIEDGHEVFGLVRRSSTDNTWRLSKVKDRVILITGDMSDSSSLVQAIRYCNPDEVYNLAAMSYVGASWKTAESTMDINAVGLIRLLDAIRTFGKKDCRIYQASSSEQFGKVQETPQKEDTKFYPRSPYGISKVAAHWIAVNYRESYGMFISCGICFNHESHRRGLEFLSRKVAYGVAKIKLGMADHIELGNLDAKRDFGYAPDYTRGMQMILCHKEPADFVLATGETHSVEEFVVEAFKCIGITDWKKYVKINPEFVRPAEVDLLKGNFYKAASVLKWFPTVRFEGLVDIMVNSDVERLERGNRFE